MQKTNVHDQSDILPLSDAPGSAGTLKLCHTSEDTVLLSEQFGGASFLGDPAGSQDYDLIRSLHGAHAVRDDQNGLSCQKP